MKNITKVFTFPKQGFSSPDASWFRGESIDFVNEKLLNKNSNIYNFIDFKFTKNKIFEHTKGNKNNRLFIWSMLSLQEIFNRL